MLLKTNVKPSADTAHFPTLDISLVETAGCNFLHTALRFQYLKKGAQWCVFDNGSIKHFSLLGFFFMLLM